MLYLCTRKTETECSAVGSALRSGRRGRAFESPHSDTVKDKPLKISGLSHFKQIRRDEIGTPYFMGQILFSDYNANILPAEYFGSADFPGW